MNKLKIAATATRATTLALRLRGQRMLPTYVKVVSSQLHTKQAAAFEESFVSKVSPIFRKQIESAVSKLRALSDMQVFTAAGLRDKIFNPADWNEELIQRALPVIAGAMSTSAVATLQQVMHGIHIYKSWTPSEKRAAKPAGALAVGSGTNCGIGPNGFQPGNTCARGDGGGSSGGGQAVNTDQQSVKPRGLSAVFSGEKLEVPKVHPESKKPSVADGMAYLGSLAGRDINLNNPKLSDSSINEMGKALADDVLFAYGNTQHEGGWYSSDIRKTYELAAQPHAKNPAGHPELRHSDQSQHAQDSRFIFAACLALSSPGEDVLINGRNAEFLYRQWKNSSPDIEKRVFSAPHGFSKSQEALPDQLKMLQTLFDSKQKLPDGSLVRRGISGVADLMSKSISAKEVRQLGLSIFHPELMNQPKMTAKELVRLGQMQFKGEVMTSELPVFSIFGPKLGAFFSNIRGNMDPVTIDLWETRHLSALAGRPLTQMSKKSIESSLLRFDANRADIDQQLKTHGVDKAQFDRELDLMRGPNPKQPDPNGAIAEWVKKQQRVYEKTQDLERKPRPLRSYADKTEANKLANALLKNLSGIHDAPTSAEKRNIRKIFVVATDIVKADPRYKDTSPAEIQAVSWTFIQRALQQTGAAVDIDRKDPVTKKLIAKTFSNSIQRLLDGQTASYYNWDHKALADKAGESRSHTNRALKKAANAAKKGESDAAALQRAAEAMQAKTLKLEDDLQRMENRLEREYKKRTGNKSAGSVFVGGFTADRDDDIYDEYGEKEFSVEYDVEQIRWNYDRSKIADPTEQVLQLLEYLERRETGLAPEKLSKVFCPTGPGGGVDPTCKPGGPTRVLFEAAPDPNNKQLHARWNALPTHVKQEISHKIVKEILPKVLKAAGVHAQIKDQFGGYMDDSNPSFAVCVPNNVKAEKVLQIARMAGFALSQDSVMVVGANEFEGSAAAGLVTLTLPKGLSLEQTHEVYKKLRTIDKGEAVAGHTTIDGHMMVVDFKGDGHGLAQKITDVTQRQYAIMVASGYVAFPEKKDYDYGQGTDTGIPEHHGGSASVAAERRNAGLARTAASAIIEQEIARYEQGRNTRGAETSIATGQLGFTKVFCPTGVGGGVDPTCKPGSGGVSGVSGRHEQTPAGGQGTAPLTGLPQKPITIPGYGVVHPGPHQAARDAAEKYMKRAGLPYDPPTAYVKVDKERAERVAAEYDQMKHDPEDPEVKAAYAAMIKETLAQYQVMKEAGVVILFNEPGENPYPNPRMATEDVRNNNRLYVFPTLDGFGSDASVDISNNPLLADSGETFGGKPATVNDIFRAVHDYFGHIKEGVGFRADGEENAWRSHSAMYSPLARRAMTSETRGQNSWLNYGPYGETNRTAKVEDTHFADQKTGLMPEWVALEGAKSFTGEYDGRSDEVRSKFNGATNEAPGTSGASGLSRRGAVGGSGRGLESFDSTSVGIGRAGSTKTSTATEWLDRLDEDDVDLEDVVYRTPYGPVAMSIATEYPVWMKFLLRENIEETFYQPYWETINETTGGDIEAVLERGMLDGYSINDMAKEIEEKFGSEEYPLSRGRNIARTECLPGDTVVDGARIRKIYKRWYSGPFIEVVTKAGRKFSGTPNHPMLTTRGWVGLGDLKETDDLVCDSRYVQELSSSGNEYVEHPPATLSKIFDSLAAVGVRERSATTQPDFHGDGMQGYVDVLCANSLLLCGEISPADKFGVDQILTETGAGFSVLPSSGKLFTTGSSQCERFFGSADDGALSSQETADTGLIDSEVIRNGDCRFSTFVSTDDLVCAGCQLLVAPETRIHQKFSSILQTSSLDAKSSESSLDCDCIATELFSDFDRAETTGVEIDNLLVIHYIPQWTGYVYNLETEDGYYRIANGVYTSNCGNALNATRSEVIDTMIEDLGMQAVIKKVWHSVLGNTTRDAHANLDGVPADKDGCWALGGIRCRWPGDPMLPAAQRCNCQCTLVTEFGMQDDEAQELIAEHQLRQLQEGKSVLTWDRKNCGTGGGGFKPGNSCARGGGGSVEELRAKAVDFFHEQLTEHFNNAPGVRVTREQAQHYTEEAKSCFDQMSAKSLGKFLAHVKQIKFYANTEDVTRALADNAEEILKTRSRVLGAFQRYDQDEPYGTLHLDGSYELRTTRAVYAHEFGHTIDWTVNSRGKGSRISDSTEWIHAQWKELSLRQLSAYAAVSPAEGFAEAHRRLLGDAGNIDAFPLCKEVFEKHGII